MTRTNFLIILLFLLFTPGSLTSQDTNYVIYNEGNSALPDNYISDIHFDNENNGWVATWGGRLVYISASGNWTVYNSRNSGLTIDRLNNLAADPEQGVWIAMDGAGVVHFDGSNWASIDLPGENIALTVEVVYDLERDHNGNVWAAIYPPGNLAHYKNGTWQVYEENPEDQQLNLGYAGNYIHAIEVLENDEIITGSQEQEALVTFSKEQWLRFRTPGFAGKGLSALALDRNGNIWVGTWNHGLMKMRYSLELGEDTIPDEEVRQNVSGR